jgi:hypothetical protein
MNKAVFTPLVERKATEVFKSCPACKSKILLCVDDEVVCANCDWDSIRLSVWAGRYDHAIRKATWEIVAGDKDEVRRDRTAGIAVSATEKKVG